MATPEPPQQTPDDQPAQRERHGLWRASAILFVITMSFMATLLIRVGGVDGLFGTSHSVVAGALHFEHPDRWAQMPEANFPKQERGISSGSVVGGACPKLATAAKCKPVPGLTYILFREQAVPTRQELERAIPAAYRDLDFRKLALRELKTADSSEVLVYEFEFRQGATNVRALIAVYPNAAGSAVVLAQGPASEFRSVHEQVMDVLLHATEDH